VRTYFVTGAAGFIGSNFVRQVLDEEPEVHVIAYDALTYAGNLENLESCLGQPNLTFVKGDIRDPQAVEQALSGTADAIVHFAAESHVDRSILGCGEFIRTNVEGTQILLDVARRVGIDRFLQVSTDEVYGSLGPTGKFTETSAIAPNSPYSASKAAADLLVLAYHHTHGLPVLITRCSNNYGPYQFPEKLIPLFITNLLEGQPVPVYGDGMNVRDWIHVSDHCRAIRQVLCRGRCGEVYNIGGDSERTNLQITQLLLDAAGAGPESIRYVKDRPGHDRRYAIDSTKIMTELGWQPQVRFEEGLKDTIDWYRRNESWWRRIKSGQYRDYYETQYDHR
jgi:dTDP-glucose 4,6-dehydratase